MSVEQPQVSRKKEQPGENCSSKQNLKVHVSGFPPYTRVEDLKYVFAPYGRIKVKLLKKHAIITFPDEDSAKHAIAHSKKVFVYASFLIIKPYKGEAAPVKKVERFVRSKKKSVIIEPQKLELTGDFNHQLEQLLEAVRLTRDEVLNISSLYVDLETALRTLWPECCAVPFGSITTGLGIKSSDADCFVQLPPQQHGADASHVKRTKRLLQQYPAVFAEVLAIPNANTPIVKLFHVPTETTCDVSFKSALGWRNSRLLAFLLHSDARLLPLAVAAKYWAKVHGLSGTGRLSNYALTMLLVFYLQQRSLLPPVESLQRGREDLVDGWNTAFAADPLPPSADGVSVRDLLGGFFEFYAAFDFADLAVCPLLGRAVSKSALADLASLPDAFHRYKANVSGGASGPIKCTTPVCIQDPFELCHNVGSSVRDKLCAELVQYFEFAATAYRESGADFLKTILLNKPLIVANNDNSIKTAIRCRELDRVVGDEWKAIVKNVMCILFEDICLAKLDKLKPEKETGAKQVERFAATLARAVWRRKRFNKLFKETDTFLEKQKQISKEILKTSTETPNLKVQLKLTFPPHSRVTSVQLQFVDGDKSDFQQFGNFFHRMIKKCFHELMKPFLPPTNGNNASIQKTVTNNKKSDSIDSDQLSDTLKKNCSVNEVSESSK